MIRRLLAFAVMLVIVAITPAWPKVLLGFGGDGGDKHDLDCGRNGVMIGLNARHGDFMDAAAVICRRIDSRGRLGEEFEMGPVGGRGGKPYRKICPPSSVVAAVNGTYGRFVNAIILICREWNMQAKAPTSSERERLEFVGAQPGPQRHDTTSCDAGNYASGLYVSAGAFVDHISLVCDAYEQ